MLDPRPFGQLGTFANDWLDAHYHFSFADYHDLRRMGLGALRVWNDDLIAPGTGFAPHGHRDMEIVTYVREGAISHEDSLGHKGRTEAGQVQVMSAGSGIVHAEYNHDTQPCRLFQIWIAPRERGLAPRWETRPFPRTHGRFEVLASGHPEDGAPLIAQDARVLSAILDPGTTLVHRPGPSAYLVAAKGTARVNGIAIGPRSGLAITEETALAILAEEACELVMVDLG